MHQPILEVATLEREQLGGPQVTPGSENDSRTIGRTHLGGEPVELGRGEDLALEDGRGRVGSRYERVAREVPPLDGRAAEHAYRAHDVVSEPRRQRRLPDGDLTGSDLVERHVSELAQGPNQPPAERPRGRRRAHSLISSDVSLCELGERQRLVDDPAAHAGLLDVREP
jgi:hypothetical protein